MKSNYLFMRFLTFILGICFIWSSCTTTESAGYDGQDLTEVACIRRDKNTKAAYLDIQTAGDWTLYAGPSVDEIDFSNPILNGHDSGSFKLNVPDSIRSYFQLITQDGKAILAERHLPMAGGYNFRDLGGIKNSEGRYVKWGKIFRSDDLSHLTPEDLRYLSSIPLISVVDFRSEQEINVAPDKVPATTHKDYAYSITPGNLTQATDLVKLKSLNMDSLMMEMNVLLVSDSTSIKRYKDFFELLQDSNEVPLLFHCSAGKDRTGMGAALILYALGVDDNTILQDYLLSNTYLEEKYVGYVKQYPQIAPLFQVKPEFLQAGINTIKEKYGSVENYFTDVLNVDINKFREMYLY